MDDEQRPIVPEQDLENIQTPNFEETPAPITPPPLQSNKKRNLIIIISSVLVLLLIGAGITYWLLNRSSQEQKDTTQDNNSIIAPEDVTAKIRSNYAAKYSLVNLDDNNQPAEGEMAVRSSETSPFYKVDGYDFYTDYDGGSTLELMAGPTSVDDDLPRAVDTTIRTEVAEVYTSYGLAKQDSRSFDGSDFIDVYVGRGVVCTIETPSAQTSSISASCGMLSEYTEAAAILKPIVSSQPDLPNSSVFTGLKLADSLVEGYQKATVNQSSLEGIGGSLAMFYKKNSEAWQYFTNTQDGLLCSRYDTVDLRSAFKGDSCYANDDTVSKVE